MGKTEVTRKSLKDSDIDIERVRKRLEKIGKNISKSNKMNLTDINVICEEIFGQILNKLYDINLKSLSVEVSGNFIAVDLIDEGNRIAYQVTSRSDRAKIDSTIEKFNKDELKDKIDKLKILVLTSDQHRYRGEDCIGLKNGNTFSYAKDIVNFEDLVDAIKMKNTETNEFIVEIYDIINMVYDSGRLQYTSIVKESEDMKQSEIFEAYNTRAWVKGYGDIHLAAFIPLSYEEQLTCKLQFRQFDMSGAYITFGQDRLIEEYFLPESQFEARHYVGRYEDEDEIWMQIENVRFCINAHTAYHIYELFRELKEEYYRAKSRINVILGVERFKQVGGKYLLMIINDAQWKEILYFAREHDWGQESGEIEWNIFNNNWSESRLLLSPNMHGQVKGDILAILSVEPSEIDNELNLYWEPGSKVNEDCMSGFDNVTKWKADYTKDWVENKLLEKAHAFYRKNKRRR